MNGARSAGCDKVCPLGMFIGDNEEYILMNGELHYARRLKKAVMDRMTGHRDLLVAADSTKAVPKASEEYTTGT